jgi:hypothetical protein
MVIGLEKILTSMKMTGETHLKQLVDLQQRVMTNSSEDERLITHLVEKQQEWIETVSNALPRPR